MGARKDLERAKRRADLAARTRTGTTGDEHGVVREARAEPLAPRPATGSTADIPFTNAAERNSAAGCATPRYAISGGSPFGPRPGTVGPPIPATAVRIADDGEVLVQGGIVFGGYRNDPAATGDLGSLDGDGYLTVTGRKKDVLVTSGGENGSPTVLEDRLRSRPPVGQCLVVGDNRPYVAALVTLDPETVGHWLAVRGLPAGTPLSEVIAAPGCAPTSRRASTTPTRPSPAPSRSAPPPSSRASSPRRTDCSPRP